MPGNEKIIDLERLKKFRQLYNELLETGKVVPLLSKVAKQIEAISLESGTVQETPFILQGTGTANGTGSVDTADVGKHLEKQGNSVVVNQLIEVPTITFGVDASANDQTVLQTNVYLTNGTKLLLSVKQSTTLTSNTRNTFRLTKSDNTSINENDSNNANLSAGTRFVIMTVPLTDTFSIKYWCNNPNVRVEFTNFYAINLTQMFGSNANIPQDLLDHPENFYRYYNGSFAYNTGALTNSDGRYLQTGGRNLFDGQLESGSFDNNGQEIVDNNYRRSKNEMRIISNLTYYCYAPDNDNSTRRIRFACWDKDHNFIGLYRKDDIGVGYGIGKFNLPVNVAYIRLYYVGQADYSICISIWYATGDGYNQYYAYETPKIYDTGTEILRSVPTSSETIKDTKQPSGLITRNVIETSFTGNETWSFNSTYNFFYTEVTFVDRPKDCRPITSNGVLIRLYDTSIIRVYLSDNNLTSSSNLNSILTSSVKYNYALYTPTTEQGTSFDENIEINDYGTMSWLTTSESYVDIPQGCKIFYPADYVLFLDSLLAYLNGDATKIVKTDNAQTITGLKTFSALPQSSATPTNNNDLTNKSYVDSGLAGKADKTTTIAGLSLAENRSASDLLTALGLEFTDVTVEEVD